MSLQPLSPTAVADKCTELYALTDTQLGLEADAVESNFASWIAANFALAAPQTDFLARMDIHGLNYFGAQCSMAFRGRLPITLIWPTPTPGYTKVPLSKSTLRVAMNNAGVLETYGTLTFEMEYRP